MHATLDTPMSDSGTTRRLRLPVQERVPLRAVIRDSLLGPMLVVASERGIRRIHFGDSHESLRQACLRHTDRCIDPVAVGAADDWFTRWVEAVSEQIARPRSDARFLLDAEGTPFQQVVWNVLTQIPMGETISYAELARRIGRPTATRAVASACGANPIAVLVPCHRVLRSDGGLGGYRWGVERKETLLRLESQAELLRSHRQPLIDPESPNSVTG